MKYKGKYSLKSRLLREDRTQPWGTDNTRRHSVKGSGTTDDPYYHDLSPRKDFAGSTTGDPKSTRNSLSALAGTEAELFVMELLKSWQFAAGREGGRGNPDVHFNANNKTYNVEVGLLGKVLQTGAAKGGAYVSGASSTHVARQAALGNKPHGAATHTIEQIVSTWEAGYDDFLCLFKNNVTYWYSLSDEAAAIPIFDGKAAPRLNKDKILRATLRGAGEPTSAGTRHGPSFEDILWRGALEASIGDLAVDWANRNSTQSVRIVPEEA